MGLNLRGLHAIPSVMHMVIWSKSDVLRGALSLSLICRASTNSGFQSQSSASLGSAALGRLTRKLPAERRKPETRSDGLPSNLPDEAGRMVVLGCFLP